MPARSEKELLTSLENSQPDSVEIDIMLDLAAFYLFKNGEADEDLSRSIRFAQQARAQALKSGIDPAIRRSDLLLGTAFIEGGDLANAAETLRKADAETQVRLAINYSAYQRWGGIIPSNLDSALYYAGLASRLAGKGTNRDLELSSIKNLGDLYYALGNRNAGDSCQTEMIRAGKAGQIQEPRSAHWLSEIHSNKGSLNIALRYALEALRLVKTAEDSAELHVYYFNLALIYRYTGEFQNCLNFCGLAYNIYKIKDDNHGMLGCRNLMSEALLKLNRKNDALELLRRTTIENKPRSDRERILLSASLGKCYTELKQFDAAEKHFMQSVELTKKNGIYDHWLMKQVGQFYTEAKQYEKARPYLEEALRRDEQSMAVVTKAHLYFLLFRIDSAAGNYVSAINYLMKNKNLDDSIVQATKLKQINELQIQYETAKKDQDLQLQQQSIQYLEEQTRLKQSNLQVATQVKNLTLGGIVLLTIIVLLLYYQYQIKQRKNAEISQKNISLERLIHEKEWLLKEVHHRVKNNLHTVMSLLESQSAYLEKDALAAIKKSQHRVYAMSLIHQRLYQSENNTNIDMAIYLPELILYLRESFDTGQQIRFQTQFDPIILDISKAIPIGLILNEAITNSIKYAFPENRSGEIKIEMHKIDEKRIRLSIADNGIGLPPDWETRPKNSLGLKLMQGLSDDIQGQLNVNVCNGTEITLEFREELVFPDQQPNANNSR